ncbi:sensor histidine kinase [Kitasatospora kifunensis]|uniref:histidine kinase n=1 Tax=Kitasatospora kifunensis TaxID=58351 RepID=A0A7W7R2I0_KITKI|nr:HAMP domain-containing sensor histidine kinase [Kitasatospora kifunensis]MBB4924004.1 signal transduction histidine kinase [Kitasatospora kifunensis]
MRLKELLNPHSLRWKIAALVAVAAVAVALAVGLLVHQSTWARAKDLARDKAISQLQDAASTYRQTGTPPTGVDVDSGSLPPVLALQARAGSFATAYDDQRIYTSRMWAATVEGGHVLSTRVDMTSDRLSIEALDRHMVYASLAALAVIVPIAALAAELPNRRLRRVAATARRISAGDLRARTGQPTRTAAFTHDEVDDIAAAFDHMADAMHQRLITEQRFTADVAHELRTPLSGLVVAAELLPDGEATDLVRDRIMVLRTMVENLLEISHLDAGVEQADLFPVPLPEVVIEAVERTGLQADMTVRQASTVETDPRRLDRIIANLLINAHRHGRAPVEITIDDATVTVRDHGPGYPPELLAEGPQRFRTGTPERGKGHGLGLTIALGQAAVLNARLDLANAPDGGATATLRLA